ncbi:hypothetical protein PIROE2DRAFT_3312 [Piromyces sp. E2]|nr:hypothetical protein PIROE2DRAFT_3312 [Piromyces sp. E2]|eukprot:OUM68922.1 hypothetical protein PIROE2DRAFT_3312 [Piromyces sp. E2]
MCKTGEGEVCLHSDGKFYESGRGRCWEYLDHENASHRQYFNSVKHKRVLPESTLTTDPIVYECDPTNLPKCKATHDNKCQQEDGAVVDYCVLVDGSKVYKTVDNTCVEHTPAAGELLGCVLNGHTLPVCDQVSNANVACVAESATGSHCISRRDGGMIYKSTASTCTLVTDKTAITKDVTSHYYFDKEFKAIASVTASSRIYTRYACTLENGRPTCNVVSPAAVGEVVRTASDLRMCLANGESVGLTATGSQYLSITTAGTEFAGLADDTYTVKTIGNGIVKVGDTVTEAIPQCNSDDETELPCVKNGSGNVNACYTSTDSKLYLTTQDNKCKQLTITAYASGKGIIHFARDHSLAQSYTYLSTIDADSKPRMAYQCSFGGDGKASGCVKVTGHVVTESYLISCSNRADDDCTVRATTTSCTGGEGVIVSDGICFGNAKVALPTATATASDYIAFKATDYNAYFGLAKGEIALVELGKNYAITTTKHTAESAYLYFVNQASPSIGTDSRSEPLIRIDTNGSGEVQNTSEVIVKGGAVPGNPTYYVDAYSGKQVITCTYGGACVSENKMTESTTEAAGTRKYFVSGEAGKLIVCGPKNDGSCAVGGSAETAQFYGIDAGDASGKSVIHCDGTSCVSKKDVIGFFITTNAKHTGEKLVKCSGSSACTYGAATTAFSDATTLKYASNKIQYKKADNSFADVSSSGYELLTATDAQKILGVSKALLVFVTEHSVVQDDNDEIVEVVDNEIIIHSLKSLLIMPRLRLENGVGYYRRVGVDAALTNALIKCTAEGASNCAVVTPTPGYYRSAAGLSAIVKCDTEACAVEAITQQHCKTGVTAATLPTCTSTATNSGAVCSGSGSSDSENGSHCISGGKIYVNSVSEGGSVKNCAELVGTAEGAQSFFFDRQGKRSASPNAGTVMTYICNVGSGTGFALSGCVLSDTPVLPQCTAADGDSTACFANAPVGSVCVTAASKLLKTASTKSCVDVTGDAGKVRYFDENFVEMEGEVNASDIKYTYACTAGVVCNPVYQKVGGVIRTNVKVINSFVIDVIDVIDVINVIDVIDVFSGAVASERPTALPVCDQTANADTVCSGVVDASNDGTHCLSGEGVIYRNTVTDNGGACDAIVGTAESVSQYFAFDGEGRRVDVGNVMASTDAGTVTSTYMCLVGTSGNGYPISACILSGNPLPTCDSDADGSKPCYAGAAVGSYCVKSDNSLMKATGESACGALIAAGAGDVFYFNEEFMALEVPVVTGQAKYQYVCGTTSGADCSPVILPVASDASGNVVKVCTSDYDDEAIDLVSPTERYKAMSVAAVNDFPGTVADKLAITVKVTTENSVVKAPYSGAALPECKESNPVGGTHCVVTTASGDVDGKSCTKKQSNKEVHITSGGACKILTGTGGSTSMVYFKKTNEMHTTALTASSQVSYAYSCTFSGSGADQAVSSCTEVYGYTFTEGVAVACTGLEGEECSVHAYASCSANDVGRVGLSGNKKVVCFGASNGVELPTDTSSKYIAFTSKGYNSLYAAEGLVFLKLTKDTVSVLVSGDYTNIKAGYYVNESANGLKNALVYCAADGSPSTCVVVDGTNGYFKSAYGKEYVVRCDASTCRATKLDQVSCGYDTLLPTCTNIEAGKKCIEAAAVNSHCIRGGVVYKNGEASCTAYVASTDTSPQKFYFDNGHLDVTSNASAYYTYYQCTVASGDKTVSGCVVGRKGLAECTAAVQNDTKCFDGGEGAVCLSGNKLLKNSGTKCVAYEGLKNTVLYFTQAYVPVTIDANASNIGSVKYAYSCSSGGTAGTPSALSSCAVVRQSSGKVVKTSDGPKLCISSNDREALLVAGNAQHQTITVENNAFPGVKETGVTQVSLMVKVAGSEGVKQGIIDVRGEAGLPACAANLNDVCKSGTTAVAHCLKNDIVYETRGGKCEKVKAQLPACDIAPRPSHACTANTGVAVDFCEWEGGVYRTNGNKCVALTVDGDLQQFSYYGRDYEQVYPARETTDVYYAYHCTYDATGLATGCTFAKGISMVGDKAVACNGWKNDVCTVKAKSSGAASCAGGVGGIKQGGSAICVNGQEVALPKDGYRYAAFTATGLNAIYGVGKGDVVLVKMTATAALLTDYAGEEAMILLDQANIHNDNEKKPLIQCTAGDGCVAMASATKDKVMGATAEDVTEPGIAHAYYVDGAFPNGEQIIKCEQSIWNAQGAITTQGTCTSAAPAVSYYVDAGHAGQLITCDTIVVTAGYGTLPTCENISTTAKCIADAEVGSHCIYQDKLFVTSGASACTPVKICRSSSSAYALYSNGASAVTGEKIVKCDLVNGAMTCAYYADIDTTTKCVDAGQNNAPANEGKMGWEATGFKMCLEGEAEKINESLSGYVWKVKGSMDRVFTDITDDLLFQTSTTAMVAVPVGSGYYFNAEKPDGSVIRCTENMGCTLATVDDVFCTGNHATNSKLPVCTDVDGSKECYTGAEASSFCIRDGVLYQTQSGEEKCKRVDAMETCTSTEAAAACIASGSVCMSQGKTYISESNKCTALADITTTCESIKAGKKCVANAESGALCRWGQDVYQSGENACTHVTSVLDGVSQVTLYFDTTFKQTTLATVALSVKSVYKCTHKNGLLYDCARSERLPGEMIYASATDSKVCLDGLNVADSSASINNLSSDAYKSIDTEKVEVFPGAFLPGTHDLHLSPYKVELKRERDTLPACDAPTANDVCRTNRNPVAYCVFDDKVGEVVTPVLYHTTADNRCQAVSGGNGTTAFYFFTDTQTLVEEVKASTAVAFAYKCRFGGVKRCSVMKGYVITNGHIVHCNGWGNCTVTPTNSLTDTCGQTGEGQLMGNGSAVCISDTQSIALPTDASTKYVMYQAGPTSPYYGQHQGNIIFLALTARSATIVDGGEEVKRGYYQNVKIPKIASGTGEILRALVFCATDGDLSSCHAVNGRNGYYLSQDSDRDSLPVIRCERFLGCWKQSVEASCRGNGSLSKSGTTVTLCGAATALSSSASRVTYKSLSSLNNVFPGATEENESVVKIGRDGSALLLEDGIHLNENVRGAVDKAIYDCSTSGIKTTCTADSANYGYYRNAGTAGYQDQFLACSINGCQAILVDAHAVCGVNTVGQLVGEGPTLCLNFNSGKDKAVDVDMSDDGNEGHYMVAYNASNVFGLEEDRYAYVDVDAASVLLKNDFTEFVYTDGQKEGTTTLCATDEKMKKIHEFRYVDYGIYELNCEEDDEGELCQ